MKLRYSQRPDDKSPPTSKAKRVLVIDDDVTLEPILRATFRAFSPLITVDWLYSADDFMSKITDEPNPIAYELILTDINLPGTKCGFDVWNYLAQNSVEIPVVIMSGLSQDEYLIAAGRRLLPPWYLTKPLNTAENRELIKALLQIDFATPGV